MSVDTEVERATAVDTASLPVEAPPFTPRDTDLVDLDMAVDTVDLAAVDTVDMAAVEMVDMAVDMADLAAVDMVEDLAADILTSTVPMLVMAVDLADLAMVVDTAAGLDMATKLCLQLK